MSLKPQTNNTIPEMTARVARAAFAKADNILMKMRDEVGAIYEDEAFEELFPRRGQPAEAPANLAMVTIMQYVEDLSDRAATDAVRGRIDWKYALGLELEDEGFHYSVLCKFRKRLLENGAEEQLFTMMLTKLQEAGLLKAGGKQRTDSTHIVAAIRALNRLVLVGETMRHALDTIAAVAPSWLQTVAPERWYKQYGTPVHEYKMPKEKAKRATLARQIGEDGMVLMNLIYAEGEMNWLKEVSAVETLRRIWVEQFYYNEERVEWRSKENMPKSSQQIISPYDLDARHGQKRQTRWMGYKVHLTERCDADAPRLITHVETRPAPEADTNATTDIHAGLAEKGLLPDHHLVDMGYVAGHHIVAAQQDYGIELYGPIQPDSSWQAKQPDAFDLTRFEYDWENKQATCPEGKTTSNWNEAIENDHLIIHTTFRMADCRACPSRSLCTRSKKGRKLTIRPQEAFAAITARRELQETEEFKEAYGLRAGVEGTMSQTAVAMGMRRNRYRGHPKTHFQHLATATAVNLKRAANWLFGYSTAETRVTRFAALAPAF